MAGKVEVSQFTGAFAKLNGSTDMTATRPDIIRSLLTVGYSFGLSELSISTILAPTAGRASRMSLATSSCQCGA
jgi:hypothetical protein